MPNTPTDLARDIATLESAAARVCSHVEAINAAVASACLAEGTDVHAALLELAEANIAWDAHRDENPGALDSLDADARETRLALSGRLSDAERRIVSLAKAVYDTHRPPVACDLACARGVCRTPARHLPESRL